jgi:hypothetical protein
MDLLAFEPEPLYFEQPLPEAVLALLTEAGACYGSDEADSLLDQAQAKAPEHPMVWVALYRNHFYRHRLPQACTVGWQVIAHLALQTSLPGPEQLNADPKSALSALVPDMPMTVLRFYLSTLKGIALMDLRLGNLAPALALLEAIVQIDTEDRLGCRALYEVANAQGESPDTRA